MKFTRIIFLVLFILCCHQESHAFDCVSQAEISTTECNALNALYTSTNGDSWTDNTGWNGTSPCSAYGVGCRDISSTGKTLYALNLSNNQLSGIIPVELGGLTNLTFLWLEANQLSGSIPVELGSLTNLTQLNLSNNQLSGAISVELGGLTNLTQLGLDNNQLSGSIPVELGGLTNLTQLGLSDNQLSGSIPSQLGGLTNLTELWLGDNQLSGSIPSELGGLTNLTQLGLGGNQLSGSIPVELGGLTNLTFLWLSDNQLSGSIPVELGDLTNLTGLSLDRNQLSGSIPAVLGNLTNLNNLALYSNQLSGVIPISVAQVGANITMLNNFGCSFYDNDPTLCIPNTAEYQAIGVDPICSLSLSDTCIDTAQATTHFEFSDISGSYAVGEPFNGTLSLVDTDGTLISVAGLTQSLYQDNLTTASGTLDGQIALEESSSTDKIKVDLLSTCGPVSPSKVELDLTAGEADIEFKVLRPGDNCKLIAQYSQISGDSNEFQLVSADSMQSQVKGRVVMNNRLVDGATVELCCSIYTPSEAVASTCDSDSTDADGKYALTPQWIDRDGVVHLIDNTLCRIKATFENKSSAYKQFYFDSGDNLLGDILIVDKKQPVLLVPGLMGTDKAWQFNIVPSLPKELAPNQDDLSIHDPGSELHLNLGQVGWEQLKSALEDTGLYSVFYVPWDWRLEPNDKRAIHYLTRMIDQAKETTGFAKVDIIAHSLGGLLVRSYLQDAASDYSTHYRHDIDRFAMVGTPNHGSSFAYPMWEGGEPVIADNMKGDVGYDNGLLKYFYTKAVDKLYQTKNDESLIEFFEKVTYCSPVIPPLCSTQYVPISPRMKLKTSKEETIDSTKFIKENVRSLNSLMPTWLSPLQTSFYPTEGRELCGDNKNDLLEKINSNDQLQILNSLANIKVFASSDISTINTITVTNPGLNIYPDGTPVSCFKKGVQAPCYPQKTGDGTVPFASASLEPYIDLYLPESLSINKGEHAELIKTFRNELVDFLKRPISTTTQQDLSPLETQVVMTSPEEVLTFSIDADKTFIITDPSGKKTGINLASVTTLDEIPDTKFTRWARGSGLSIKNPLSGEYQVVVTGALPDKTTVTISYLSEDNQAEFEVPIFYNGKSVSFTLMLNQTGSPILSLHSSIVPPATFTSEKGPGGTTLKWSVPASGQPAFYNIYHRSEYEPLFALLATVPGTELTYNTSHEYEGSTQHLYTMSAVNSSEVESFLSPIVSNQKVTIKTYEYPGFPWPMFLPAINAGK